MTEQTFTAFEAAFRVPGETWKRRVVRTEAQADAFWTMVEDEGAEVRVADDGGDR